MRTKTLLVVGARPNFMKIAPLYREMLKYPQLFEPVVVHTGQHYDANMSKVFFDDLGLPQPDVYLGVGSGSHAWQTAEIMLRFEKELERLQPGMVVVVGDVNSTIACALAAVKFRCSAPEVRVLRRSFHNFIEERPAGKHALAGHKRQTHCGETPVIAHIESGERSFDFAMPEEINRVATDRLSDMLFTATEDSAEHLLAEGMDPRRIFHVGHISLDAVKGYLAKAKESEILRDLGLQDKKYALATLHRSANVDEPAVLRRLLQALQRISERVEVVFPVHPRTRQRISAFGKEMSALGADGKLRLIEPAGYLDFLRLQSAAALILTDSGGVQVEASYLGVPCLTLREKTEWEITLSQGSNRLVGTEPEAIVKAARAALKQAKMPCRIKNWDGKSAERIVATFKTMLELG